MPIHDDQPMYRTFEEFELEEMRRADSLTGSVDALFDDMFADELDFESTNTRLTQQAEPDEDE